MQNKLVYLVCGLWMMSRVQKWYPGNPSLRFELKDGGPEFKVAIVLWRFRLQHIAKWIYLVWGGCPKMATR